MNILGDKTNYNKAIVMEAIFCMSLTACPSAWYFGVSAALESMPLGGNLVVEFISVMKASGVGSVSGGQFRRRQPSSGSNITLHEILLSLRNFIQIIDIAEKTTDTEAVVKQMSRPVSAGGMAKVGELIANELLNVATKTGVIRNTHHAENPTVASSTSTGMWFSALMIFFSNFISDNAILFIIFVQGESSRRLVLTVAKR